MGNHRQCRTAVVDLLPVHKSLYAGESVGHARTVLRRSGGRGLDTTRTARCSGHRVWFEEGRDLAASVADVGRDAPRRQHFEGVGHVFFREVDYRSNCCT